MLVLVINCGSSSLKYQLLEMTTETLMAKGLVERIGIEGSVIKHETIGKEKYVLTTPSGGIITNKDGSDNFPPEQVASEGKVMKVADYKKYLATQDISKNQESTSGTAFFGAWIPTRVHVLYPNQEYQSNAFYARGWRYGEERFKPSWGSGNYLYWQAQGDSGLVEDGYGISVVVNDGGYVPVNSRRGTYFKTYNPNTGSRYKVSNPV